MEQLQVFRPLGQGRTGVGASCFVSTLPLHCLMMFHFLDILPPPCSIFMGLRSFLLLFWPCSPPSALQVHSLLLPLLLPAETENPEAPDPETAGEAERGTKEP